MLEVRGKPRRYARRNRICFSHVLETLGDLDSMVEGCGFPSFLIGYRKVSSRSLGRDYIYVVAGLFLLVVIRQAAPIAGYVISRVPNVITESIFGDSFG